MGLRQNIKGCLVSMCCILVPSFIFAQGEVGLIEFKIKRPDRVDILPLQDGKKVLCFLNNKQQQLTLLNPDYSFSSAAFPLDKSLFYHDYLGASRNQKIHTSYFYNEKQRSVKAFRIDLAMGTTLASECLVLSKEESFLSSFVLNNKFYVLSVDRHSSIINLFESEHGSVFSKTSFETGHPFLHKAFEVREEELNEKKHSAIGIDKINYELENNLKSAHANNKLYLIEGQIIITIDDPVQTWFCVIDATTKKLTEKSFSFSLEKGDGSRSQQGNSFLYKKNLFRATLNDEMLNLSIINTDSATLLWNQNIFPDAPIEIKNGPMISEGSGEEKKVLLKTGQFFNRIQNGKVCLAVNEINEQYVLQIGSYEYKESWGGPAPSISMGMSMGMGMGMGYPMGGYGWGMPGYYYGYPGYYPNTYFSYIQTTYFYSLLDSHTFEHLNLAPPKTLREMLNEYEEQKFKKGIPDLIAISPLANKKILLGYYAKNIHKYQLVEIR